MSISSYITSHSFEDRKAESDRVRSRYPDRIPVICELVSKGNLPPLDKNKYLVPGDLTVGQFAYIIRKRIHLKPDQAIFLLVNGKFPSTSTEMSLLYSTDGSDDGYLYVHVAGENAFG